MPAPGAPPQSPPRALSSSANAPSVSTTAAAAATVAIAALAAALGGGTAVRLVLFVLLLAVIGAAAIFKLAPRAIQHAVRVAPLDKLVVIHDVSVLGFTPDGLDLRLHLRVLGTRLPLSFLTAGLQDAPTATVSLVVAESPASRVTPQPPPRPPSPLPSPASSSAKAGSADTPPTAAAAAESRHVVASPLARVCLSETITATGLGDLRIRQSCIRVHILSTANVRALLRRILEKRSVAGIRIKLNLAVTIQVLGFALWRDLPLEKVVDLGDALVRKNVALKQYLEEKEGRRAMKRARTAAAAAAEAAAAAAPAAEPPQASKSDAADEVPTPTTPAASDNGASTTVPPSDIAIKPGPGVDRPTRTGVALSGESRPPTGTAVDNQGGGRGAAAEPPIVAGNITDDEEEEDADVQADEDRARGPADGVLPGLAVRRRAVETSLRGVAVGLALTVTRTPALRLSVGAVTFDVLLNGHVVARGRATGLTFGGSSVSSSSGSSSAGADGNPGGDGSGGVRRTTAAELRVEIVPAVVASPVRGLLSSARGVLRGALAGAVSGLAGGEWGSGAAMVSVTNLRVAAPAYVSPPPTVVAPEEAPAAASATEKVGSATAVSANTKPAGPPAAASAAASGDAVVPVAWLDEVLAPLVLEHDLDAVRRVGGAARGAWRDLADAVLGIFHGLLGGGDGDAAGDRGGPGSAVCVVM
ncbi:hypothetical protein HK405_002043 [Cladochytrium tenue]|nr:hypothetical protein HK405_002043 [Cladochytrium tenue]